MINKQVKQSRHVPRRGQFTARIAEQTPHGNEHRSLVLEFEGLAAKSFAKSKAGQFVQIACRDLDNPHQSAPTLRRPFSIACVSSTWQGPPTQPVAVDPNADKVYIEILYRIIGPGTQQLATFQLGKSVDIIGPLGNGFSLPKDPKQKCFLVGGGIGLPPMYCLADQLVQNGQTQIIGVAGGRTTDQFEATLHCEIYKDHATIEPQLSLSQFSRSNTRCMIATDDGSCGFHGNVVQLLEQFLEQNSDWKNAWIYTCGPEPMLKGIAKLAEKYQMPCQLCMEAYMSCGIGLCQSCAVAVKSPSENTDRQYKLVCTNGPVFDAKTILWD